MAESPRKMYRPLAQIKRNSSLVSGLLKETQFKRVKAQLKKLGDVHREQRLFSLSFGDLFTQDFSAVACKPLVVTVNCLGNYEDSSANVPKVIQLALHRHGSNLLNPCASMALVVRECQWKTLNQKACDWWKLRLPTWKKLTKVTTPYVNCLQVVQLWLTVISALNHNKPQENHLIFLDKFGTKMMPQGVFNFTCLEAHTEPLLLAAASRLGRSTFPFKKHLAIAVELPQHWQDSHLPWDQESEVFAMNQVLDDDSDISPDEDDKENIIREEPPPAFSEGSEKKGITPFGEVPTFGLPFTPSSTPSPSPLSTQVRELLSSLRQKVADLEEAISGLWLSEPSTPSASSSQRLP